MQSCKSNHFVSACRCSADPKAAVALRNRATRTRVEDLVEHRVADAGRSCTLDERQSIPLTHYGQVACTKQLERCFRHRFNVLGDEDGVVVCSGAIRTGDWDHL